MKLVWTVLVYELFLILEQTPIWGLNPVDKDPIAGLRGYVGSTHGSVYALSFDVLIIANRIRNYSNIFYYWH